MFHGDISCNGSNRSRSDPRYVHYCKSPITYGDPWVLLEDDAKKLQNWFTNSYRVVNSGVTTIVTVGLTVIEPTLVPGFDLEHGHAIEATNPTRNGN